MSEDRTIHDPRWGLRGEGGKNTLETRPFLTPDVPRWPLEARSEWPRCMDVLRDPTPTEEDTDAGR